MKEFFASHLGSTAASVCEKIVFAIIVLIVGSILVKLVMKKLPKAKAFQKMDSSASTFIISVIKFVLYALLVVIVISILGVPMTSIVAAITSCFLAIGLALQGALSNFAGGIMILIFKPFRTGDFITCAGGSGVVDSITVFYTTLITADNTKITVPNGTLMNDCVKNGSSKEIRRVDVPFKVAYSANLDDISAKLTGLASKNALALQEPAPAVKVTGYDAGIQCALLCWCKPDNYWDLYFDLQETVSTIFACENSQAPVSKVIVEMEQK